MSKDLKDTAERLNMPQEELSAILDLAQQYKILNETYTKEQVQQYLQPAVEKNNRIVDLQQQLTGLEPDQAGSEYSRVVGDIMAATQDYYTHIAGLPAAFRKLLLAIADVTGGGQSIQALDGIMDQGIPLEVHPLVSSQAIRPGRYIMQIDAITNQLATLGGQTQLNVGKRGSQPVTTTVTLDMPDHMKIEGGHVLSTYEKSIINGVTSLLESGNTVFSIPMLYHAMTGRQNPTVDEQLGDEISGKLEKMRRMMLTIDLAQEREAQFFTNQNGESFTVEELTIEGYLLPLSKVSGVINGKKTELYQIIHHPPLYSYAKMKRQLASVRISLLGAPVNNNSTTIPLKTYMLQRIELMKNKKNSIVSLTILYDSIYQELGAMDANKTKKMRIRTYATTILDYFVDQTYIQSYVQFKKGRNIAGVDIYL